MNMHDSGTGIRAAQESDLAAVYDVWYRTDVLTNDLTATPEKGPVPAYLRHVLGTGTLLVAERNGDIVGFAGAVTRGDVVFLTDLFVDPRHQSSSLGKRLLQAALPGGDRLIHCTLSSSDPRAQALYIRSGMVPAWPYFGLRLDASTSYVRGWAPLDVHATQALASDMPEMVKVDAERSGREQAGGAYLLDGARASSASMVSPRGPPHRLWLCPSGSRYDLASAGMCHRSRGGGQRRGGDGVRAGGSGLGIRASASRSHRRAWSAWKPGTTPRTGFSHHLCGHVRLRRTSAFL